MGFVNRLKQLICKHDYKLFANIYGDLINDFDARTIYLCEKCGKRKFVKEFIEAPVNYNHFLYDCAQYKKTGEMVISPETIKNTEQYNKLFGIKKVEDIWSYDLGR